MWTLNSRARLPCSSSTSLIRAFTASIDALGVAGVVLAGEARELERAVLREDQELGALLGGGAHPDAELADVVVPAVVPVDGIGGGGDLHARPPCGRHSASSGAAKQQESAWPARGDLILLKTKGKMELETGWNLAGIRLAILACRLRGRHDINKRLIETGASRGGDDAGGDSRGRPARLRREGVRGDGHPRDRRRRRMQRRLHLLSLRRQGGPARRLRRAYRGADGQGAGRGARRGCAAGEPGGGGGDARPAWSAAWCASSSRAGRRAGRGLHAARDGPAVERARHDLRGAVRRACTRGSARVWGAATGQPAEVRGGAARGLRHHRADPLLPRRPAGGRAAAWAGRRSARPRPAAIADTVVRNLARPPRRPTGGSGHDRLSLRPAADRAARRLRRARTCWPSAMSRASTSTSRR